MTFFVIPGLIGNLKVFFYICKLNKLLDYGTSSNQRNF